MEIQEEIGKLRNGKLSRDDEIDAKLLKYGEKELRNRKYVHIC